MTPPQIDTHIEFEMDAAYFAAFHAQWVAAVGRGWRVDRVMVPIFAVLGVTLIGVGLTQGELPLAGSGVFFAAIAALERVKGHLRRKQWIDHSLRLPWAGETMRIGVQSGRLVQMTAFAGDPRFARTGELLDTPDGFLLRYAAPAPGLTDPPPAVSSTSASVYIPLAAVTPPMSRAAFRALLV